MTALLAAARVRHAFRQKTVLDGISLSVSQGEFVAIIGPNGSGKSTLLRCLGRLLRPDDGVVRLGGEPIFDIDPREFARRAAFVSQGPTAPPDILVEELVWRGRFPYRGLFGRRQGHDRAMVEQALMLADVGRLRHRAIGTLSGGERQRAFIALALAQEPSLLLLDEPTTFLDIAHQLDLLALLARLNRESGMTVVAVMHDLGQAALFARRLVAVRDGRVVADGDPPTVVTEASLQAIFGAALRVTPDPVTGLPLVLPAVAQAQPPVAPRIEAAPQPAEKETIAPAPAVPTGRSAAVPERPRARKVGRTARTTVVAVPASAFAPALAPTVAPPAAAPPLLPKRRAEKPRLSSVGTSAREKVQDTARLIAPRRQKPTARREPPSDVAPVPALPAPPAVPALSPDPGVIAPEDAVRSTRASATRPARKSPVARRKAAKVEPASNAATIPDGLPAGPSNTAGMPPTPPGKPGPLRAEPESAAGDEPAPATPEPAGTGATPEPTEPEPATKTAPRRPRRGRPRTPRDRT